MKILGKTYDNADFRKILRNSLKKVKKNLRPLQSYFRKLRNRLHRSYVNNNNNNGVHSSRQEGSNALSLVDLSECDLNVT